MISSGTGPNEFEGNLRFREMVGELAMSVPPREISSNKAIFAQKVVDRVQKEGGHFVRKLSKGEAATLQNAVLKDRSEFPKGNDIYVEVPIAVAIEKAKQSFRHQQRIQGSTSSPPDKSNRRAKVPTDKTTTTMRKPTAIKITKSINKEQRRAQQKVATEVSGQQQYRDTAVVGMESDLVMVVALVL